MTTRKKNCEQAEKNRLVHSASSTWSTLCSEFLLNKHVDEDISQRAHIAVMTADDVMRHEKIQWHLLLVIGFSKEYCFLDLIFLWKLRASPIFLPLTMAAERRDKNQAKWTKAKWNGNAFTFWQKTKRMVI